MNGPSVTAPTRIVLAVAGGCSWYPASASLPEPPPPFSYQVMISPYHAWPSASVRLLLASVPTNRMTYFTVASQSAGPPVAPPSTVPRTSRPRFRHPGRGFSARGGLRVLPAAGQPRLQGQDGLVAPPDIGPVGGLRHRPLAGPVNHRGLLEQHPALSVAGRLGHDPGQRLEHADHHR